MRDNRRSSLPMPPLVVQPSINNVASLSTFSDKGLSFHAYLGMAVGLGLVVFDNHSCLPKHPSQLVNKRIPPPCHISVLDDWGLTHHSARISRHESTKPLAVPDLRFELLSTFFNLRRFSLIISLKKLACVIISSVIIGLGNIKCQK